MSEILNVKKEKVCVLCNTSAVYKTLVHRNTDLIECFVFHSQCIKDKVMKDGTPIDALRMMNLPYVHDLWMIAEEKAVYKEDIVTEYMKIVGPRKKYKDFMDSEFGLPEEGDKFNITDNMIARWGPGRPDDEYIELETAYNDLCSIRRPLLAQEEKRYIGNVLLYKRARDLMTNGTANEIKNIQDAYIKDLKDIGLDQATISGQDKQESLGQRIGKREEQGPLPELAPEFRDVDGVIGYIQKGFLYPLLRNLDMADQSMISEIKGMDRSIIPSSDGGEDDE